MENKQVVFGFNDFTWEGINKIDYKPEGNSAVTFRDVSRQNIFKSNNNAHFDVRYFECAIDGHSTLEKHEHAHIVMILRGIGKVIVGNKIYDVKPHDLIVIPAWATHQLINIGEEPFGFICTVDAERDKFQLLSKQEIEDLMQNSEISQYIKVPDKYFA